ncbi:MAG: HAD hydrolase-like protein [Candidatus Paceibacterota bacterium]
MLVIIDFNRTIFDPDTRELMEGARHMLGALARKGARLVLVSKNDRPGEPSRYETLTRLGVVRLFDEIRFVDAKDKTLFGDLMRSYGAQAGHTYVIGDYLYEEIRAGNQCGAITIRFKRGAFASDEPQMPDDEPTATVTRLMDIPELVNETT